MEKEPSFESELPTREEVISILRDRGIDDPEVKRLLLAYESVGEATADALDQSQEITEERIKMALEMAKIYFEAGYKEYAIQSLEELLLVNESVEMFKTIQNELDRMLNEE